MKVITGFGYYQDSDGHIVNKYVLPIGEHPDPVGMTVVEVADQIALDTIQLYVAPPTPEQQRVAILLQLADIDSKSIRAIRTSDMDRMSAWEEQAVTLRAQLVALNS